MKFDRKLNRKIPEISNTTAAHLRGNTIVLSVDALPPGPVGGQRAVDRDVPVRSFNPDTLPPPPDTSRPPAGSAPRFVGPVPADALDLPPPPSRTPSFAGHETLPPPLEPPSGTPLPPVVHEHSDTQVPPPPSPSMEVPVAVPPPPDVPGFGLDIPPAPEARALPEPMVPGGPLPAAPLMPPAEVFRPEAPVPDAPQPDVAPKPKILSKEERWAYIRAVALYYKLTTIRTGGRRGAIERLVRIVETFPHATSRRVIGEMLEKGCGLAELEDAVALKDHWRADSALWLRRTFRELYSSAEYQNALGWQAAQILAAALGRDVALEALQGVLLHEWMNLEQPLPGSAGLKAWSLYSAYVKERAEEIFETGIDPMVFAHLGSEDSPVMPDHIHVRSGVANFAGKPTEKVYLPRIENHGHAAGAFSTRTKREKTLSAELKGETEDAG